MSVKPGGRGGVKLFTDMSVKSSFFYALPYFLQVILIFILIFLSFAFGEKYLALEIARQIFYSEAKYEVEQGRT